MVLERPSKSGGTRIASEAETILTESETLSKQVNDPNVADQDHDRQRL